MKNEISVSYVHQVYPRLEEVILTQVPRGEGKDESDPCRTVDQVHHKDGTLIAENDPCHDFAALMKKLGHAQKILRTVRSLNTTPPDIGEAIDSHFDPDPL